MKPHIDLDAIEEKRRKLMKCSTRRWLRWPPVKELLELSADVLAVIADNRRLQTAVHELEVAVNREEERCQAIATSLKAVQSELDFTLTQVHDVRAVVNKCWGDER